MSTSVEVDDGSDQHSDHDGNDSTFSEALTDTTSLKSSVYAYETENGRTYHSFHAGKYQLPNDEGERERMDIHYHAMRLSIGDKLFFAPLKEPSSILDVGTGTGIWAMDVADEYPEASVVGFDLSPIQPMWVPPNLSFEVCDADEEWNYGEEKFDLVHTRLMNGFSIKSWPHFYKEAFAALKPGGWVENQEFDLFLGCDDNSVPPDSKFLQWTELWQKGITTLGMTGRCFPEQLVSQMHEAGFVNTQVMKYKMPIGTWPKNPQLKQAGLFTRHAMAEGLHGLSAKVFKHGLNWSSEELEVLLADVRTEMGRPKMHTYWPLYIVIGQKPVSPTAG